MDRTLHTASELHTAFLGDEEKYERRTREKQVRNHDVTSDPYSGPGVSLYC